MVQRIDLRHSASVLRCDSKSFLLRSSDNDSICTDTTTESIWNCTYRSCTCPSLSGQRCVHGSYFTSRFDISHVPSCSIPITERVKSTHAHHCVLVYTSPVCSITPRDFNSFGSRRGNDAVMVRGTFNHVRLNNKLVSKRPSSLLPSSSPSPATTTLCLPDRIEMDIFDASEYYRNTGTALIILAGKDYGCGPSRDWVAKGPWMLVRSQARSTS